MAYRRNDDNGRVIGFKDGQPVYKRINRGESGKSRNGARTGEGTRGYGDDRKPRRDDRGPRQDPDRRPRQDGGYGAPGERGGKRIYKGREGYEDNAYGANRGYTRGDGKRDYREGGRDTYREGGRGPYREGKREFREGGPRFADERLQRKVDRMNEEGVRAPHERKQYDNFKPLPRDIPEEQAEVELPNIIMGRNPVKEAIKTGRSIDKILVISEHDGSLNEILDLAFEAKLVVRNVDRSKLDEICMPFGHNGRPGNHQGIIAYVPEAQYCELSDILDYAKEKGEDPFVVLLDGIEDPHNLGSIIRSAECAGAHGVVIPKRRAASVTAAVVKTSAGATEHMRIAKVVNLAVAIERLKEAGVWVAGADMGGEPMYSADLKGPFALVVGAEGAGVSRLVKEKCDYIVSVPLKGQMESLNASVAAAVIMFEKVRQESGR